MKMVVVTTITTTVDVVDKMRVTKHEMDIDDQDGISDVSRDVLGAILLGAFDAGAKSIREQFPGAARAEARSNRKT